MRVVRCDIELCHLTYCISSIRHCGYYLFRCLFCAATIRGQRLFLWKALRHQRQLDKVTVTVARRCQKYAQPLSPAVSHGNDSYNTNSPSASVVTIRNHSHTCAPAVFTSRGYYLRVVFI